MIALGKRLTEENATFIARKKISSKSREKMLRFGEKKIKDI